LIRWSRCGRSRPSLQRPVRRPGRRSARPFRFQTAVHPEVARYTSRDAITAKHAFLVKSASHQKPRGPHVADHHECMYSVESGRRERPLQRNADGLRHQPLPPILRGQVIGQFRGCVIRRPVVEAARANQGVIGSPGQRPFCRSYVRRNPVEPSQSGVLRNVGSEWDSWCAQSRLGLRGKPRGSRHLSISALEASESPIRYTVRGVGYSPVTAWVPWNGREV
jgi:hypothetical protein